MANNTIGNIGSRENWSIETLKPKWRARQVEIERPVRTRKGNVVWLNIREVLPEWWPCLCNGGWELCPVCQCGVKDNPPCVYCSSEPIEPADAAWPALADKADETEARCEQIRLRNEAELAALAEPDALDDGYWHALLNADPGEAAYYEGLLHETYREAA